MSDYVTKKITLPGGRVIDIVYFADGGDDLPDPELLTPPPDGVTATPGLLHLCPSCGSDLVYPVAWEERPEDMWYVARRCPDCEWRGAGEHHQCDIELFDDVLNDGTDDLLGTLRGLTHTNMEEDVEALIRAIDDDQILPMDF
jgi:hypothetical protein